VVALAGMEVTAQRASTPTAIAQNILLIETFSLPVLVFGQHRRSD
jgi:hypothetical protein